MLRGGAIPCPLITWQTDSSTRCRKTASRNGRGYHKPVYEHDHHSHDTSGGKALATAVSMTLTFAAVELLAGWWAGSLALMADAGHMLTDSAALGLAALAAWIASRPANRERTWGHGRAEVLAALFNALVMMALVAVIAWRAGLRFQNPVEVKGLAVMGVALIGLGINIAVFLTLRRGRRSINVRGAMLHVLGDLLGSLSALTAGIVIMVTGWTPVDPLLSLVICVLILFAAARLLREGVRVVMEGVPANLDLEQVRDAMTRDDQVKEIHDLHIWQVSSERVALSAHVVIDDLSAWPAILARLNRMLAETFDIDHPTLQPEPTAEVACDRRSGAHR